MRVELLLNFSVYLSCLQRPQYIFVSAPRYVFLHRGLTLNIRKTRQMTRVSECTYLRTEEASMNSKFNTSRTLQLCWLSTANTFTIPCRYSCHDLYKMALGTRLGTRLGEERENLLCVTSTRLSLTLITR